MKVGLLGAGKMGEAIVASLVNSKTVGAHEIFACDVSEERRGLLKQRYAINTYSKNRLVVGMASVLVLAVKPQQLGDVLREIAPDITGDHLIVSIAAGKSLAFIESFLPDARVVRVMPNLPCVVGEGMSVFCLGSKATPADKRTAVSLLECFGKVLQLPESQFHAVTAVSGSGPAFFAYVLDRVIEAGADAGLDPKDARLLAEQTMLGTSRLLIEKSLAPRDLIQSVASARGTTAAGLEVLDKSPLSAILLETVRAAARRSEELSREP